MRRLSLLLAVAVPCAPSALAQSTDDPVGFQAPEAQGARAVGLAGAGIALGGDVWGGGNPAAWSGLTRREVSLYADQRYGLAELRSGALRAALPLNALAVGLGVQSFGYQDYRVTTGTLGAAKAFRLGTTRRVHAGLAANVHNVAFGGDYGSGSAATLDAGVMTDVLPQMTVAARATNLLATGLAGAPLPRRLALGLAYRADARLTVVADLEQEVREDLSVRAGVEVRPVPSLALRAGAATGPRRLGVGASFTTARLVADVAADYHPDLGLSPAVGLTGRF